MAKKPSFAGQFYAQDKTKLIEELKDSFFSHMGPGQDNTKILHPLGFISPHAGYMFSGPAAAWSFSTLNEQNNSTFIILGLGHNGQQTCLSKEDWTTPLGVIETDKDLAKALNEYIPIDEFSHSIEHSIEVQLPFLQYRVKKPRILPIIVSSDANHKKLATLIFQTASSLKRKIFIIASSDFSHIGPNYGYTPFDKDIKKNMYAQDFKAIDFLTKMDEQQFLSYINEKQATICGIHPIITSIHLTRLLGATKAKLLKYYTSGDIINDYENAVGYASIVFL